MIVRRTRPLPLPPARGALALVVLLAVTATPLAAGSGSPIPFPEPTGPHAVGTRLYHWVDPARRELGTEVPSHRREMMVQIWYPGERQKNGRPAPYLHLAETYESAGLLIADAVDIASRVRHHAWLDAAVARTSRPFPVIVFSTGNGEMLFVYTALMEELASHGYAIAVISHPGIAHVGFPDGRVLERYTRMHNPKPEGWDDGLEENGLQALRRAVYDGYYEESADYLRADVSFVVDQLQQLNADTGSAFHGSLNLERLAVMGHSHGGNIAVEACGRDQRVKACINLDGAAFGRIREEGLQRPYMLIRPRYPAEPTPRGVAQAQILGSMRADAYEIDIQGANHRSFMDDSYLFPERDESGVSARVLEITSTYVRAFLDRYLQGRRAPLLDRRPRRFPDIEIRALRVDSIANATSGKE